LNFSVLADELCVATLRINAPSETIVLDPHGLSQVIKTDV